MDATRVSVSDRTRGGGLFAACELWCLTQRMLTKTLGDLSALLMAWREEVLGRVPIFQALSKPLRRTLANQLTGELFRDGDTIMTRGESGDTFYLIESGEVKVRGATQALHSAPCSTR